MSIKKVIKSIILNEISAERFNKALDIARERNQNKRIENLASTYYHEFIGIPFKKENDGKILDITINYPKDDDYKQVSIHFEYFEDRNGKKFRRDDYVFYHAERDEYQYSTPLTRRDAVILSKIAKKINPDTKYSNVGSSFDIEEYTY